MKHDHISFAGILTQSFRHPFKVDLEVFCIEVRIESLLDIWTSELPNLGMVDPAWVRDPYRPGLQPGGEKHSSNVVGSCARNGLDGGDALQVSGCAKSQFLRTSKQARMASQGQMFMVEAGVCMNPLLGL